MSDTPRSETAVLGGGCFWCVESVFELVRGVAAVESGYTGGRSANPTYRDVCSGTTGHAEVIKVAFDPSVVTFRQILEVFFAAHDPTTLNRQGADVGTQYRSAIYYQSPEQKETAEAVIAELNASGQYPSPIVTEVSPPAAYYRAEDYHQGYFRNNPADGYCRAVAAPKMAKVRKLFAPLTKG